MIEHTITAVALVAWTAGCWWLFRSRKKSDDGIDVHIVFGGKTAETLTELSESSGLTVTQIAVRGFSAVHLANDFADEGVKVFVRYPDGEEQEWDLLQLDSTK